MYPKIFIRSGEELVKSSSAFGLKVVSEDQSQIYFYATDMISGSVLIAGQLCIYS
jgi:hypothetical protein